MSKVGSERGLYSKQIMPGLEGDLEGLKVTRGPRSLCLQLNL